MIHYEQTKIVELKANLKKSKKIHRLLEEPILKEMTVMFLHPSELVIDKRGQFCCMQKCRNYNTRCYCPPYSLNYQDSALKKNLAIIFAKTYDFSELSHFINYPQDYNYDYIHRNRVFVRRWVQSDFYKKIKKIFEIWGFNSEDIFAGGFSLKKCNKCLKSKRIFSNKCLALPSPEALGIDVKKTLEKLDYYLKFGVKRKITKVSMLFTNIPLNSNYLNTKLTGNDKPFREKMQHRDDFINELSQNFKFVEFNKTNVSGLLLHIKEEYNWLKFWSNAILWRTHKKSKKRIQNEIHRFTFMNNNYYALDFDSRSIFNTKLDFDGVEFY